MSNKKRAIDWLKQAQNDYKYANQGLAGGYYSQVCFISQQSAEKAIKAIAYYHEYQIKGHSIAKIAKSIGINSEIESAGKRLDLYYISARYPDALPEGAPFEFFSKEQAKAALDDAELILKRSFFELNYEE